jgi:hypothetical protein
MARRKLDRVSPEGPDKSDTPSDAPRRSRLYKPTARECALLLLRLIEVKGEARKREITRLRVAEVSLTRLWGRRRISPEFAEEVAEWLSAADFSLFFAGTTYAVVKTSVVESWPRATSKRLSADVLKVAQGAYDFSELEYLLPVAKEDEDSKGEEDDGG